MKLLVKILIALVLVSAFGWLFLRTARGVRSEAYTVPRRYLQPWTLAIETATQPRSPMLVLRAPQELGGGLFTQIFQRMMESLKGTTSGSLPLVLRDEYELALASHYTPEALLEAARSAGLESGSAHPGLRGHAAYQSAGHDASDVFCGL